MQIPNISIEHKKPLFKIEKNYMSQPLILFNSADKSHMLKCPKCNYITNKTFNYDIHKCINVIPDTPPQKHPFISSKIPKIEAKLNNNNFNSNLDLFPTTENEINKFTYEKDEQIKFINDLELLKKIFNPTDHLNIQEIEFGNYIVYDQHTIDSGSYGNIFLGCNKETKIRVAIKQISNCNHENYLKEKGILSHIRGKGNYPEFLDSYQDSKYYYIIESLMGPSIELLKDICGGKFNLFTTINIGIDLIKNIRILHDSGIIHRDLKPNNIVFGSLGTNFENKLNIGIVDFGNSNYYQKIVKYINKKTTNKFHIYGNRLYSSNNVLINKPCSKADDIISLFYILIELLNGDLPWIKYDTNGKLIKKKEIMEIRKNCSTEILCRNFPIEFNKLFDNILKLNQNQIPPYSEILKVFQEIKYNYVISYGEQKYKFEWIEIFNYYLKDNKSSSFLNYSKDDIKSFIKSFGLNFNEYINFLTN